jgi:phospholipid-binding lipoprotein MlaA
MPQLKHFAPARLFRSWFLHAIRTTWLQPSDGLEVEMRAVRRPLPLLAAATLGSLALAPLTGCAHRPPASDVEAVQEYEATNDPLEPTNRVLYGVNSGIDAVVLKPAALGYRFLVPAPLRTGIHNVLENLRSPVLLANDVLETKPRRAGDTFMRFLINSTVGIGGILDVASDWGYPAHDADFGMTLALWGVDPGPFLFLPILGPSDPRDGIGLGIDVAMDPFTWVGQGSTVTALDWSRYGMALIDGREQHIEDVDNIKKTALDPYATFRSLYRQHRQSQIDQARSDKRATVPAWYPQPPATPAPGPAAVPR